MQNLPSQLLHSIILFIDPKQAFTMKRLSKHFRNECEEKTLWKAMLKAHHPDFPSSSGMDYQGILKSLSGGDAFTCTPDISDFKFTLTFYNQKRRIGVQNHYPQPNEEDPFTKLSCENLKAELREIIALASSDDTRGEVESTVVVYITFNFNGNVQVRRAEVPFNEEDDGGFRYSMQNGDVYFDVEFDDLDTPSSVKTSFWDDVVFESTEPKFIEFLKQFFKFYF